MSSSPGVLHRVRRLAFVVAVVGGLPVAGATAQEVAVDFSGDGRSDYPVVRNTGGGPSGGVTWFVMNSANGSFTTRLWGIATDFFVPGDYDGDGRTDHAIWRPLAGGVSQWWIVRSSNGTTYSETFGTLGDDPTVQGDYDGDGKTDIAVYRPGASAGQPSFWIYKRSIDGVIVSTLWGQNGDFPAPGDYDGDGRADFAIQRNGGGGQAIFWFNNSTAGISNLFFGTPTDVIVPGDYDGDGRTDVAIVRGQGGAIIWWVRQSSNGMAVSRNFGVAATDFPTQGDYDGDGRTDAAIWRPSATPGASAFWVAASGGGTLFRAFGQNGDYPVANFNSH